MPEIQTVPATDIKRRGMSALDEALKTGPVHVIKNNRPRYVVLTEEQYAALRAAEKEVYQQRIRASLEDLKAGRTSSGTAQTLIKELGLDE